ncbi:phosphoadenosine phosphosulfate reductase family protein [Pontibacter sp. E15-1]|uniref:phosphoadenosine phosphosulfate reductase family protein n=1 Tax=Pontibacter sp. E15-1 TaxID=2919918 RepID=UPI001F4F1FB9|nr:phosphoadenosine phosphosulfate reductase family protein [Pontibacter sp. E15-1]MCJ8165004.1 phosphoadenosine phosphosulfate reductase family protein [Pontibacter sp. E15-1]
MSKKVRHVLGISGGKDSAALALYLKDKYPEIEMEYYYCDTGEELPETYDLLNNIEGILGKKIIRLSPFENNDRSPFDKLYEDFRGYLPSSEARWCTKKLKLEPFEKFVGDDPVVSYVGIRGDEDREGYISKKSNIQSIFPFRKNIWSEDVIQKVLQNDAIPFMAAFYNEYAEERKLTRLLETINRPLSFSFRQLQKLNALLDADVKLFNAAVFAFLKTTGYPLAVVEEFPLVDNDEVLVRDDIFRILRDSSVGVPKYYEKIPFEVNGKKGEYARSRSGCYFCFFQQKIEWVWLFENHLEDFLKAELYEKGDYTWMQGETLRELIGVPYQDEHGNEILLCEVEEEHGIKKVIWINHEILAKRNAVRTDEIKEDYIKKASKGNKSTSLYLLDILDDSEGEGCAACFI